MGGGGGSGGGQDASYYYNIMRDREQEQENARRDIEAQQEQERQASAAETQRLLGIFTQKDTEAETLKAVEENKKAIQRANPNPFMTAGYTGYAGADTRLLGGAAYTLG